MRSFGRVLVLALFLTACASATPTIYNRAALQAVKTWTVEFSYEPGRTEETNSQAQGATVRVVREGIPVRNLKLRDDLTFALKDKHGLDVGRAPRAGAGTIRILPVDFGFDDAFRSLDVEFVSPTGETEGRVQLKNGDRNATMMDDDSFMRYAAESIAAALR